MANFLIKNNKIIIFALLAAFTLQGFFSLIQKSITVDEEINISAGYSYWKTREIKLNPQSPPLIKLLGSAFIFPLKPSDITKDTNYSKMEQGDFSQIFIYKNSVPTDKMTFFARIPFVFWGIILGIYIYLFSSKLFNKKAGIFALFLYSFCPNILAHSSLVTSDLTFTLFVFLSAYYLWEYFKKPDFKRALILGVILGLAQVSKFTSIYLIPLFFLFFVINFFLNKKNPNHSLKKEVLNLIIIYFIAWCIIWIFYLPFAGKIDFDKNNILSYTFLPEKYLDGAETMASYIESGRKDLYFFGHIEQSGWWYYYIVMFFIKIPLPILLLIGIAILNLKNWIKKPPILKTLLLIIPFSLFIYLSFFNKSNVGFRHILFVIPFLFIFISPLVNVKNKKIIIIVILLLVWHVINSLQIYPDYLMYFNSFAGGPDNGFKISVTGDDWGQDYLGLKKYLKENNIKEFYLVDYKISVIPYFKRESIKVLRTTCGKRVDSGIVAARILHLARDPKNCFSWLLKNEKPFKKIGYSIWLYNF